MEFFETPWNLSLNFRMMIFDKYASGVGAKCICKEFAFML